MTRRVPEDDAAIEEPVTPHCPGYQDGETRVYSPEAIEALLGARAHAYSVDEAVTTVWAQAAPCGGEAPTRLDHAAAAPHVPPPREASPSNRTRPWLRRLAYAGVVAAVGLAIGAALLRGCAHQTSNEPMQRAESKPAVQTSADTTARDALPPKAPEAAPTAAEAPTPRPKFTEADALQALASRDDRAALAIYRQLAESRPDNSAYALVTRVLASRVPPCAATEGGPCP